MADEEFTGKILINDGENTIEVNITGRSEKELYDIYNFMRNMKKDPIKYNLELEIDWSPKKHFIFTRETFIYWIGYGDWLIGVKSSICSFHSQA